MTKWFGNPWPDSGRRAPVCGDDRYRVPVPVGQPCIWCQEPMEEDSRGVLDVVVNADRSVEVRPCHRECSLRRVVGGPGHLLGACLCSGADCDPDLGMPAREAAILVWKIYHQLDDPDVAHATDRPRSVVEILRQAHELARRFEDYEPPDDEPAP